MSLPTAVIALSFYAIAAGHTLATPVNLLVAVGSSSHRKNSAANVAAAQNCPVQTPPMPGFQPRLFFDGNPWWLVDTISEQYAVCTLYRVTLTGTATHWNVTLKEGGEIYHATAELDEVGKNNATYALSEDANNLYVFFDTDYTSYGLVNVCNTEYQDQFIMILSRTPSQPANIAHIKANLKKLGFNDKVTPIMRFKDCLPNFQ